MGDYTTHWEVFGQIPPQGGLKADRKTTLDRMGLWMDVSPTGGCDGGIRITGGGDLRLPYPEHIHTVNCDHAHYGPEFGNGAADGVNCGQVVVEAGQFGLVGDG